MWWRLYSQHRFAMLLVILIGLLAGPSMLEILGRDARWYDLLMSLLMLAAILSLCFETYERLFALLLGIPTIAFVLLGHALTGAASSSFQLLAQVCEITFFLAAAAIIVRSLFSRNEVSFDSILGAVCGYLFLGLAWAVGYSIIEHFHPGSFKFGESVADFGDQTPLLPQLLVYYSFVTLSTVGYGDITPVSPPARTFAWMEAITGQFYVAVIVAGLVSLIVAKKPGSTAANDD
jgi:hypothetical protein